MERTRLLHLSRGFATTMPLNEAREAWATVRGSLGLRPTTPRLLTWPTGNAKFRKGGQYGLSLAPHRTSGANVCMYSTKECRALCIYSAGRGSTDVVQRGRNARTVFLFREPAAFRALLRHELSLLPSGVGVRLNTYSDVPWELVDHSLFWRRDLHFYDYTKYPPGARKSPPNYRLTYSATEQWSVGEIRGTVAGGLNVAVVFRLKRSQPMPDEWHGIPVIDGDKTDARYDDPDGIIVGLRAKGRAFRSNSPFVRDP